MLLPQLFKERNVSLMVIEDLKRVHTLYLLKEVNRYGTVKDRQESAAEHTYSMLILAQFFLPKIEQKLDELKVMKMILYDDIIEVEVGDSFILDRKGAHHAKEREAFGNFVARLPEEIADEYKTLWQEHEEGLTAESKFALAIDAMDPIIHSMFKYEDWRRNHFTEVKLREKKEKYFKEFPIMMEHFNALVEHLRSHDAFDD
jgi:putative hydrolases of HD superfamily